MSMTQVLEFVVWSMLPLLRKAFSSQLRWKVSTGSTCKSYYMQILTTSCSLCPCTSWTNRLAGAIKTSNLRRFTLLTWRSQRWYNLSRHLGESNRYLSLLKKMKTNLIKRWLMLPFRSKFHFWRSLTLQTPRTLLQPWETGTTAWFESLESSVAAMI